VPELLEIEAYRRLAEPVVGRRIVAVIAPDPWFLKGGITVDDLDLALVGARVEGLRRLGKLVCVDLAGPDGPRPVLGLRFGMTGRLLVDGRAGIERLEYGSDRGLPEWDRFALAFAGDGELRISDPRRLGAVELDPDESRLGPDATTLTPARVRDALGDSDAPLKARLLDQSRVAGLGNLLVDETLWRAGLDPARRAGGLGDAERRRLLHALRRVLDELGDRGGSHTGDLMAARVRGGSCPRDGTPLDRRTIGGRTTYSCPHHQR